MFYIHPGTYRTSTLALLFSATCFLSSAKASSLSGLPKRTKFL